MAAWALWYSLSFGLNDRGVDILLRYRDGARGGQEYFFVSFLFLDLDIDTISVNLSIVIVII